MKKLLLAALLAAVTMAATAATYTCQIDHSAMYATGRTQVDSVTGKLLSEYKCLQGHTFWLAPDVPNAPSGVPVAPTPPPPPSDYSYLHDAGKQQMEDAGRQLGQSLNNAVRKPEAVAMILTVKCHMYVESTIVFDNNATKVTQLSPSPASDANLAAARAAFPRVRVETIDAGC